MLLLLIRLSPVRCCTAWRRLWFLAAECHSAGTRDRPRGQAGQLQHASRHPALAPDPELCPQPTGHTAGVYRPEPERVQPSDQYQVRPGRVRLCRGLWRGARCWCGLSCCRYRQWFARPNSRHRGDLENLPDVGHHCTRFKGGHGRPFLWDLPAVGAACGSAACQGKTFQRVEAQTVAISDGTPHALGANTRGPCCPGASPEGSAWRPPCCLLRWRVGSMSLQV